MPNLQLYELKSATKNAIENATTVILRLSSNLTCIANDKTHFSHQLSLNNTQVSRLYQYFANSSYAKTIIYIFKTIQSSGFQGRHFGSLIKSSVPLMKNLLTPLPKSLLVPLGWTVRDPEKFIKSSLFESENIDNFRQRN